MKYKRRTIDKKKCQIVTIVIILFSLLSNLLILGYFKSEEASLYGKHKKLEEDNRALQQMNNKYKKIICSAFNVEDFKEVKTMTVTATAYSASVDECDATPEVTASGQPSRPGEIALSRDVEKAIGGLNKMVVINGYGITRAPDRMNQRWSKRIDIMHANKKAAKLFGLRTIEISWLE